MAFFVTFLYLSILAFVVGGFITLLVWLDDRVNHTGKPNDDFGGWHGDYDPKPIMPVTPEDEEAEDLACV